MAKAIRPQVIKDWFGMGAGGVRQDIPADVAEQQIANDPQLQQQIESETQHRAAQVIKDQDAIAAHRPDIDALKNSSGILPTKSATLAAAPRASASYRALLVFWLTRTFRSATSRKS